MDVSHILDGLNDAQRMAVTAPQGSALIALYLLGERQTIRMS